MVRKALYYIDLIITFALFYIKRIIEYKTDFLLGVIPLIFSQIMGLVFLNLVFLKIPNLNGWSFEQVLLVYGFYILASAFELIIFENLIFLKGYIFGGKLDLVLIRPLNPIFFILLMAFNEYAIGQIVLGIIVVGYAMHNLGIIITIGVILKVIYFVAMGTIILGSFTMISVTFYFFTEGTFSPLNAVRTLDQFLKYPLSIFNKYIQILLTWVLPLGFVSYYPAVSFLNKTTLVFPVELLSMGVVVVLFYMAIRFFNVGLRKYQGTGN